MTTPPNKSRLVLVYGGRATTDGTQAMPVRRYRLARVTAGQHESAGKPRAGRRDR